MDDKKKQETLAAVIGKNETVKASGMYPNLYTQMALSIADLERLEHAVYNEIKELYASQGDAIVDDILKSIYPSFVSELMEGDGDRGDADEEISITRGRLYDFAGDIYLKVEAAIHLKSAMERFHRIREIKSRIELANKGILL